MGAVADDPWGLKQAARVIHFGAGNAENYPKTRVGRAPNSVSLTELPGANRSRFANRRGGSFTTPALLVGVKFDAGWMAWPCCERRRP